MRIFFAIEFEEDLKEQLYFFQQEIKRHCSSGNFSHMENFHLTLRFIGDQKPEQLEKLTKAMHLAASEASRFVLKLNKPGLFSKGNKKIVWMGLEKSKELQELYNRLEKALEKEGYPKEERGFNPHITLVREARLEEGGLAVNMLQSDKLTIKVSAISLMESKRENGRLTYTAVDKAELL